MNYRSLNMGVYALPSGGVDQQRPHDLDETYFVLSGTATLVADGDSSAIEAGSVLFVRAGVEHQFVDIADDLELLVFFSKMPAE